MMDNKEAIRRIKTFGLHHAIKDLPHSTRTVEAFNKAIELLRLEEQSLLVKLPCEVGSCVYVLSTCDKVPTRLDSGYWDATGYYCLYEDCDDCPFADLEDCELAKGKIGIFKDELVGYSIDDYEGRCNILLGNVCDNFTLEDFGKSIFLTREEAENYIKEKENV